MDIMGGIYALQPANEGWYHKYKALVDSFWRKDVYKNYCFAARFGAIKNKIFLRKAGLKPLEALPWKTKIFGTGLQTALQGAALPGS
jgi:hypothetical protein